MYDDAKVHALLAAGLFERITLYRPDGGSVATVVVPTFDLIGSAQILVWQGRTFLWNGVLSQYVETFSFTVEPIAGVTSNGL